MYQFFILRFINAELHGLTARYGALNSTTILLENPVGKNILNVTNLIKEVNTILNYKIFKNQKNVF